jgi:HEAT repeat protein
MIRGCPPALFAVSALLVACASEPELELPPPNYEERERALHEVREKLELLAGGDVEVATSLLGHEDHRVRRAAAKRLGVIGSLTVVAPEGDGGAASEVDAGDAAPELGDAVELLIERLKDDHPRVQSAAAVALASIGDTRALDPLVITLADKDRFVRLWAWKALRRFGDDAIPVLLGHTASDSPYRDLGFRDEAGNRMTIRAPLRDGLTALGKAVVPTLDEALADEERDGWIRINAAIVLGAIGKDSAEALPTLIANVDTTNQRLKLEIVRSLGHIGDLHPEVVPTLKRMTKDPSRRIKSAAAAAIKEIDKDAKKKADREKKRRERQKKLKDRPRPDSAPVDDGSGRPGVGAPAKSSKKEPLTGQIKAPEKKN